MFILSNLAEIMLDHCIKRNNFHFFVQLRLLFLGVFIVAIAGCNLPLPSSTTPIPSSSPAAQPDAESTSDANVIFKVHIPPNTPEGQPLVLSLLDEVTGLALNVQRFPMQTIDKGQYQVELKLPIGAVIKYRYGRQGSYLAEEHTSIGKPVRYRLYRVDGPGTIEDVISAWSDTPITGPTGRIMGTVSDSITGRPVPNLLATAGGMEALTASDGSFLLEGLPPGIHNVVIYAMDGAYRTFQQGARVAAESTTFPAIQVIAAPQIPITFKVKVPIDTMPGIPLRLAGNLSQLGNTFADLRGGMSTIASRMPTLEPDPEGNYDLTIDLPAGSDLAYKYTLGDGFWNAEHTPSGDFRLRRLIVPEAPLTVEDQVDSWGAGFYPGPLIFDLTVPTSTPPTDQVSIQFNPFGWTEPVSMWPLGDRRWVFMLYNPVQSGNDFAYRYCRNAQCGSADDGLTPGPQNPGRVVELTQGSQTIKDTVRSWVWLTEAIGLLPEATDVERRGLEFITGVEIQPDFHPSWSSQLPNSLTEIQALHANNLVITPSWTFTHVSPVVLEPVPGNDPTWHDTTSAIQQAHSQGFQVAVFPTPHFPANEAEWWRAAPRDFAWWLVWFERYRSFLLHYADLAQINGAQALIVGGEWVMPALPGGELLDGTPSNVIADAASRWEGLQVELRDHFKGQLIWAMPARSEQLSEHPEFIDSFDMIYLLWSLPLASSNEAEPKKLNQTAELFLDTEVLPFKLILDKPIIVGIAYPSAKGSLMGCIPAPVNEGIGKCLDPDRLSRPLPDIPEVPLDLNEQTKAYEAVLKALNRREWIAGVISRGFYFPAVLQDKSLSIHGKPVEDLLEYWFNGWSTSN